MKVTRGAIALYVGLVFVCGGVLGFFSNRLYVASAASPIATKNPNPDEWRKTAVAEYQRRLNLSDAQVLNLNLILDETKARALAEIKAQHDRSVPMLQKIHQEQVDRIKAMLTPEQQSEYEKMRTERRAQKQKQKQKGSGGGGQHGPGF